MDDGTRRYGVVYHDDSRGRWYSVVDKSDGEHIYASRNRKTAHNFAAYKNSVDLTKASHHRRKAESESGSDWFHAGMPS